MVIDGNNISFSYEFNGSSILALNDVDLSISRGELTAILGCNGSGKSTLTRHLNALIPIQQGDLHVAEINVRNEQDVWRLRRLCGMVFQNPDNQFVSSIVEEDIAFGLENYEVPREEIAPKVAKALRLVGMEGYEKRSPQTLSGGQKQRIALAGILALDAEILIFDEATAMLDPVGRREVLEMIHKLHVAGKTVLMITHYVEEAVNTDRIILMKGGRILASGTPREILTDRALMRQAEMIPPVPVRLFYDLKSAGIPLASCPLTIEELADQICQYI